jgi:hypothetical protein
VEVLLDVGLNTLQRLGELRVRKVPAFAMDRLDFRAVDRYALVPKQAPVFAQEGKRTKNLCEGVGIILAKIRNRFAVGGPGAEEPEHLDVPVCFLLQTAAGADTVHVAVEVELE